jgi:hypothetical protein
MSHRLRGVVSSELGNVPVAATEHGKMWVLNALDPSDTPAVEGIPDGPFGDVVLVTYKITTDVYPSTTPTHNWNVDLHGWTDPINMLNYRTVESAGPTTFVQVRNPGIAGVSNTAQITQFWTDVERYRLVSGYMTVEMDATALTNSGHVVAAQYHWAPTMRCFELGSSSAVYTANTPINVWFDQPRTYAQLSQMVSAYKGEAKDGVYMPYKLIAPFPWVSTNDYRMHFNSGDSAAASTTIGMYVAVPLSTASNADFPFGLESFENGGAANVYELPQCSPFTTHASFVNLNSATHLRATVVKTYQMHVKPGTVYVPMIRPCANYDQPAITAYTSVVAKLDDAFPADFNSNGKLWPILREIGKTVLTSFVPALGGAYDPVMDQIEAGVKKLGIRAAERKAQRAKARNAPNPRRLMDLSTGQMVAAGTTQKKKRNKKKKSTVAK